MPKASAKTFPSSIDYEQLFKILPGAVMLVAVDDPNFTIIAENQAHAEVAMMDFGIAVGKPFLEAYPDTSATYKKTGISDIIESLRRVVSTGESDCMEDLRYDLKGPDGTMERLYWRATHYPIRGNSGELLYILQSTVNVTEEVKTKRRLDEAKRQLDEALAVGLIGTWLWNLDEDYVVADKNLLRLFGVEETKATDGLPLKIFTDSIHPEDRPRIVDEIEKTVATAGSFEAEYRTISRTGEFRWVIARGQVESEAGVPVRFPGVIVDITERKTAELNLRFLSNVSATLSSSLDYRRTLQLVTELAVPDLADWCTIDMIEGGEIHQVALAHKDPKKLDWAHKYRQAHRPSLDDPHGVPAVIRTGKPEFFPVIDEKVMLAAAVSEEDRRLVMQLKLSSVIIVPLKVDNVAVGALTFISSDSKRPYTEDDVYLAEEVAVRAGLAITNADLYQRAQEELAARSDLEERLRLSNERLEQRVRSRTKKLQQLNTELNRSNQELQDFAYVASHDLQEPLRKIQAFGNLMEQEHGADLGDGLDYLKRMQGAAARMSSLISGLLAFSRVSTKAEPFMPVDLTAVVQDVVSDLETRINDTSGTVKIGDLPTIEADPVQMRQLFQNLIGNALKFHQPDVSPLVRVESEEMMVHGKHFVRLSVVDNGIGFDTKYLDRIFAVFQRLHDRNVYEGTGIGLAVCRKIVERHGGTITAASQPGKGSVFTMTLPCSVDGQQTGNQSKSQHKKETDR